MIWEGEGRNEEKGGCFVMMVNWKDDDGVCYS